MDYKSASEKKGEHKQKTVAIIVWDISHNALGRGYMLADILSRDFEVKIVGFIFGKYGYSIWEPLKDLNIPVVKYSGCQFPYFTYCLEAIAEEIEADAVLVSKPRLPSLQLGLLMKYRYNKPLLLDIDDYELGFFASREKGPEEDDIFRPYGEAWTWFCESLVEHVDQVLVSNAALQEKYGGIIIPHARDEELFNPELYSKEKRRKELGIPPEDKIILFMGTPRKHKGLFDLLEAVKKCGDPSYKLCVMGDFSSKKLKSKLQDADDGRLILLPDQPFQEVAQNIAIADLVCLLQKEDNQISQYQLPAKVVDAIAMGIPVLATRTPPLEPLINKGVVYPTDLDSLAKDISEILNTGDYYRKAQLEKRNIFLEEYSYGALYPRMKEAVLSSMESPGKLPENALFFQELQKHYLDDVDKLLAPSRERNLEMEKKAAGLEKKWKKEKARRKSLPKQNDSSPKKGRGKEGNILTFSRIKKFLKRVLSRSPLKFFRRPVNKLRSMLFKSSSGGKGRESESEKSSAKKTLPTKKSAEKLSKKKPPRKKKKDGWGKVEKLQYRLYSLGFIERATADLHQIVFESNSQPRRRSAARVLACWYAGQLTAEGARYALEMLKVAQEGETSRRRQRQAAVMEAECYRLLEDKASGEKIIKKSLRKGEDAALCLAGANLETSRQKRLEWINKALGSYGISPISCEGSADSSTFFENLKGEPSPLYESLPSGAVPTLTVIMAVSDAEKTIKTALESVLAQTWPQLEVLVVDDASSDGTASLIEKYCRSDARVRLLRNSSKSGPYVSRNSALREAKGVFVTCHEADEWAHPQKLEKQVMHLLQTPRIISNTSEQVRTTSDLTFYRRGGYGEYFYPNLSSLMFWREPVLTSLGYWDSVRFGADDEIIQRIKKFFGENAHVHLPTGPLSLLNYHPAPLVEELSSGTGGFFAGARKEYRESYRYYHQKASSLYYGFPRDSRPFPVPELMWAQREAGGKRRRHFDVIIGSEFRLPGGTSSSNAEEIKAQKQMELRTGLIQMPRYLNTNLEVNAKIRDLIDGEKVQMIVHGEEVTCDCLIIKYPPVLQERQIFVPDVKAGKAHVIVNQTPRRHYAPGASNVYYIEQCQSRLYEYFGLEGTWHPIGPLVRNALHTHHSAELSGISLAEEDWVEIINVEDWRRENLPPRGARARIGRHSQDDYFKWPSTPEEILSAYPADDAYEIHVLGGAESPKNILGYLPFNWHVLEFNEVSPRDFLAGLDVFVYYTHPDMVESFGRVILEAMAVGVPVILPPPFSKLFGDAAVYTEPAGVRAAVDSLIADDNYYHSQAKKAQNYVETQFGYSKHLSRIKF